MNNVNDIFLLHVVNIASVRFMHYILWDSAVYPWYLLTCPSALLDQSSVRGFVCICQIRMQTKLKPKTVNWEVATRHVVCSALVWNLWFRNLMCIHSSFIHGTRGLFIYIYIDRTRLERQNHRPLNMYMAVRV